MRSPFKRQPSFTVQAALAAAGGAACRKAYTLSGKTASEFVFHCMTRHSGNPPHFAGSSERRRAKITLRYFKAMATAAGRELLLVKTTDLGEKRKLVAKLNDFSDPEKKNLL